MISIYIFIYVIEFILYIYICRFVVYRIEMYMFNFIEYIECLFLWNSMYILLLSCIFIVLYWEYSFKEIDFCKKKRGGIDSYVMNWMIIIYLLLGKRIMNIFDMFY